MTLADFIDMENLELSYYSSEHVTPHEEAYKWHLEFPHSDVALEDKGRIIGFMDLIPIQDGIFNRIYDGDFNDKYLATEHFVRMEELEIGETVHLLLSCIVIHEDYRKSDAMKILLNTHMKYYQTFIDKGISIGNVITSNVTESGMRFSEKLGFTRIGTSDHDTVLYMTSFERLAANIRNYYNQL